MAVGPRYRIIKMLLLKPATAPPAPSTPPAWPKHTQVCTQIGRTERHRPDEHKPFLTTLHMKDCWVNISSDSLLCFAGISVISLCNNSQDIHLFCLWSLSHEIKSIHAVPSSLLTDYGWMRDNCTILFWLDYEILQRIPNMIWDRWGKRSAKLISLFKVNGTCKGIFVKEI